jgi:flagellar M-ring protein FliF
MVDEATTPQQKESIKAAAAAAAGIDPARGDQIVVEAIGFDRTYYEEQAAEMEVQEQESLYWQYGIIGAAVLFLLIVLALFMGSIKRLRRRTVEVWRPVMKPVAELAAAQQGTGQLPPSMMPEMANLPSGLPQAVQVPRRSDEELMAEINNRASTQNFPEDEQKARIIQRLTEESPTTVAEIIQIWLNEDEKRGS